MKIKLYISEWYQDYKLPSMFICAPSCSGKCCTEAGATRDVCQNSKLAFAQTIEVSNVTLIDAYLSNPITKAVVFGGLEPFDNIDEVIDFIDVLRYNYHCDDTVVIYTGYNKTEISFSLNRLKQYKNIIVKFGRFLPNRENRYDEVLGVTLASPNQYAERIS